MEPRTKISGNVFWRLLVPRERGGDLIKSPPSFSFLKEGDLIKSSPGNQKPRTKMHQKTCSRILVLGSMDGGDLIKSPAFFFFTQGDLSKSPPHRPRNQDSQQDFSGSLGSWFPGGSLVKSPTFCFLHERFFQRSLACFCLFVLMNH